MLHIRSLGQQKEDENPLKQFSLSWIWHKSVYTWDSLTSLMHDVKVRDVGAEEGFNDAGFQRLGSVWALF